MRVFGIYDCYFKNCLQKFQVIQDECNKMVVIKKYFES